MSYTPQAKANWIGWLTLLGPLIFIVGMLLKAFNDGRSHAGRPGVYPELALALIVVGAVVWLVGFVASRQSKKNGQRESIEPPR